MSNDNGIYLIWIVLICFIAGYLLISFVVKKVIIFRDGKRNKNKNGSNSRFTNEDRQQEDYSQKSENRKPYSKRSGFDLEQDYLEILGLKAGASSEQIKKSYRHLITKYHPDKVSHLGVEFQKMAADKTRAINKAYSYLKQKYNII